MPNPIGKALQEIGSLQVVEAEPPRQDRQPVGDQPVAEHHGQRYVRSHAEAGEADDEGGLESTQATWSGRRRSYERAA